jgi:hypothetical protein
VLDSLHLSITAATPAPPAAAARGMLLGSSARRGLSAMAGVHGAAAQKKFRLNFFFMLNDAPWSETQESMMGIFFFVYV